MRNSWPTNWQPDWPGARMNDNGTMSRMRCHYFSIRTRRSRRLLAVAFNWSKLLLDKRFIYASHVSHRYRASGVKVKRFVTHICRYRVHADGGRMGHWGVSSPYLSAAGFSLIKSINLNAELPFR